MNHLSFRRACYFKIFFLHAVKKYSKSLEIFDRYNITEINNETSGAFNVKGYCLAALKKYREAHLLIDKILEKVDVNDESKANYLDSKGDFYKMEKNYTKAIEFYKKSISLSNVPPWSFHKETKEKLREYIRALEKSCN